MSFALLWPLLLVVAASVFYSISSKSVPPECAAPAVLIVTYLTAAFLSFIAWLFMEHDRSFLGSLARVNWTGYGLGFSMVGLEIGYIFMYRNGWKISVASLLANILLAVALLLIGMLFYQERLSARQLLGVCFCIAGSALIMAER